MRFWPFGKDDEPTVDFVSRVIAADAKDGETVRGKLMIHFAGSLAQKDADQAGDVGAAALRGMIEATEESADLLGREAELAQNVLPRVASLRPIRSLEVVALHVVGGPETTRPSTMPPAAMGALGAMAPVRRQSSSQMMAVRDGRLIPLDASPEEAGEALIPLLRDAATRVLVGILRAYDLVVVKKLQVDARDAEDMGELVPASTAAPGRFGDDRAAEIDRWAAVLGDDPLTALQDESGAVVTYFLQRALQQEGVELATAVRVLETAAGGAFLGASPLTQLPRYLASAEGGPTEVLGAKIAEAVSASAERVDSLMVALTPVLASLQADFSFAANRVKAAVRA